MIAVTGQGSPDARHGGGFAHNSSDPRHAMSADADSPPDDRRTDTPDDPGVAPPGSHDPPDAGGADGPAMTTDGSGISHDASLRDGRRLKSTEEGYWADHVSKRERDALLASAINASNTMVVLADVTRDDQPLIYVNRYFCEFTGYDPEEILGRNCRFLQFRHGERVEQGTEEPRGRIRAALETRDFVRTVLRNFKKDGTEFRNELFMSPVEGADGEVNYFAGVQNDTSVRDRLVDDLAASESALRGVFEASPVALGLVKRGSVGRATHLRVNPAAAALLGADPEDCVGKAFRDLGGPADLGPRLERAFDRVDAGGGPVRFRFDATADGTASSFTVAVTAVEPPELAPGAVPPEETRDARRYCYAVEDLTAFGESERERALMRAAVEKADAATAILSPDLDPPGPRFLYTNPAATRLTGYGPETLLDELVTELDGRQTDPAFPARFRQALKQHGAFRGDSIIRHADGGQKTVEWNVSAVRDDGGAATHFVATLTDVADRRERERQVLEAQAREQARIARDLHDGVAQQLAGLSLLCGTLARRVETGEDAGEAVAQIREVVADAARELRGVAHGLMPLDRGPGGLAKGLDRLAKQTAALGAAACAAEFPDGTLPVADPEVAHHLYRIAQEAVGNAVRHGGAKRVALRLARGGTDRAVLTVTDDGSGLPAEAVPDAPAGSPGVAVPPGGGMGLTAMRYRAQSIGGELRFERPDAGGTRVVCEFPHADAG